MTEAVLNNMIQTSNQNYFPEKKNTQSGNLKSFSETMREINQRSQKSKDNSSRSSEAVREKSSTLDREGFLKKLKEVLNKDQKDVPAELLSMLQSGSLSKEQEALLGKLMLNLKNNKLNISDLKSLLEKNRTDLLAENQSEAGTEFEVLNPEDLEKNSQLLAKDELSLSEAESAELLGEVNRLQELLANGAADKAGIELNQKSEAKGLNKSLADLFSTLKSAELDETALAKISEQVEANMPLLSQLTGSESLDFSALDNDFNTPAADSLFTELSAQLKEMLTEENSKTAVSQTEVKTELINSDIFSLNSDPGFDSGTKVEANNQNSFFDLDNSNLFFNFEQNSQELNGDFSSEQFSLSKDSAQIAESADLRSQVVEQFRGEYSPETKEMRLQLKPESLGKVDISLSYDNEQLTGKMLVESELVRAQLENSLKGFKSDLLKQGINIEQFKIEVAKKAPQQVEKQNGFDLDDQNSAFSDGETGQNQEYEQRQFFQGQYYVQRNSGGSGLDSEGIIMRQQEIINRAAFSNDKINLLA
ncbi:flagellar hook-length control protein FliK [Halanaerobium saccharolyticum]|uniref:Flagellar hook-length control protein FliK n=1 Tax=Halanaerobium saccharolyticum TaxID=43595 RepID=A0A4R6RR16_9FIRM|nr:flagellar hook-length control protein FliK [Halanaerobium saccharolyticum]TDP89253.1 flagellar hook-length control protein FliK [Halanaerobium saccharolyticum]